MNRHMKALELDKVLDLLAEETGCADAAALARDLAPAVSLFEAKRLMDETDAAYQLMARFGAVLRPDEKRRQLPAAGGGRRLPAAGTAGYRGNPSGHPLGFGLAPPLRG